MKRIGKKVWIPSVLFLGGVTILFILVLRIQPSNNRDWSPDQAVLPRATFIGTKVHIENVRNFDYQTVHEFTPRYDDRTYDLEKLETVWFMVERFSGWPFMAHTLVSFGFSDDSYVAISVEIRKEKEESYSIFKGMLRQYELMYVVADERDVIRLRTNYRKDMVHLYPIRTTKERMRKMFVSMLKRANSFHEKPVFYNTLWSTCTTNLVDHINQLVPKRIPWSHKVILPGYVDELAYDLGLIDTELSFEEAKKKFRIDPIAQKVGSEPDFSKLIRKEMK